MNDLQGFGLFFFVGGVLGTWGGVEQILRKRAQIRRAVTASARVVDVQTESGDEAGDLTYYRPVVTFLANGQTVQTTLLRSTLKPDEYRRGKTVRVYFDPRDPTQVVARPKDFPGGWTVTVLGGIILTIGAGLLWAGWNGVR